MAYQPLFECQHDDAPFYNCWIDRYAPGVSSGYVGVLPKIFIGDKLRWQEVVEVNNVYFNKQGWNDSNQ
jgi:hypothetical protein